MLSVASAKVFSTAEAKDGFWHLQLDEKCSRLTTVETPFGRKKINNKPIQVKSQNLKQLSAHQLK